MFKGSLIANFLTSCTTKLRVWWQSGEQNQIDAELDAIVLEDRILYSATPFLIAGEVQGDEGAAIDGVDQAVLDALDAEFAVLIAKQQNGNSAIDLDARSEDTLDAHFDQLDQRLLELQEDSIGSEASSSIGSDLENPDSEDGLEIVFVQAGLIDSESLIADIEEQAGELGRSISVFFLSETENGFDQVGGILSQFHDLSAIHFVSHGSDGLIQLGGSWLSAENIQDHSTDLQQWGMALGNDGDILIYGCDVASGEAVNSLIETIDSATNAQSFSQYHEIAFVDSGVADFEKIVDQLGAGVEVVLFDASQDGLVQISNALAGRSGIDAIHIFSHGVDGGFQVGATWVNQFTLQWQADMVASWGAALSEDADLLLYGCNVASTIDGQSFIDELALLTGADVAASRDTTGHDTLGGNWELEYSTGTIDVDEAVDADDMNAWMDVLAISANGTVSSAQTTSGTGLTWSHTVANGNDRALFVTLAIDALGANVTGVTYGGVAMTQVGRTTGNHAVEIWRLLNPTVGTANVVASFGATTAVNGGAVTYNGVHQTTPTGTYASANGTGTTASVVVTSATNDIVLEVTNWDNNPSGYTIGAGQTQNYTQTNVTHRGVSTTEAGAATVTMSSTVSSSNQWEMGAISINAAPSPPVNSVPGAQSTNEDTAEVFSTANGNAISITDADAGGANNQITISVTNGTLTLAGTTGLTFVAGDGTADATMTVRGTAAAINTALNGLSYNPTSNYNGSATLTLATMDSTLLSLDVDSGLKGRYTFDNTGDLGNDSSPTGTYDGTVSGATTAADGTRGNVLSFDGNDYVQITGRFSNPSNLTLAAWVNLTTADSTGSEVISLGDSAILRLDESGTLRGIFYNGSSWTTTSYAVTLAGTGWRHVAYTFNDTGNVATLYLDGVEVAATSTASSISYTLGANSFIGKHGNGGTTWDFTGKIDDARIYNRALTGDEIATLADDLSLIDTDTVAITVTAVNDGPSFTSLNGTPTFTEGGSAVIFDSNVTITDTELTAANNFVGATLTLSRNGGANSQDVYSATGTLSTLTQGGGLVVGGTTVGTVTTNSTGTLVLTFNANATNTLVNSVMQQIAYSNSSDAPPASSQINWTFSDGNSGSQGSGGALNSTGSVIVNITSVNDAPVLADTVLSITVAEDAGTPSGVVGNLISTLTGGLTDVDSGAIKGVAITGSVETNGTWYYTTNNGTNWTAVGTVNATSALLLADNANTRVYFAPGSNYNGTSSALTIRGWDQTSGTAGTKVDTSSSGGVTPYSSATDFVDVNVTAVNDEQVIATNGALTVSENSTGNVVSNAFLLTSDVDNTSSQLTYTITAVTNNGTLRRSGTALGLSGTFTQTDINSGLITYDHNGSETSSDSFSFSVNDGAGAASTGTFNLTVSPVNDNTPIITSNGGGAAYAVSINETITSVTTVTATDADLPSQTLTYSISGGLDASKFSISSAGVLSFVAAPDYEAPVDSNGNNIYEVVVQVSDGANTDTQSMTVTILDVGTSFNVSTTSDLDDSGLGASYTIEQLNAVNGGTDGKISLREAIVASNNTAGTDTISFAIGAGDAGFIGSSGVDGRWQITLGNALPILTDSVILDATTQTTFGGNTNPGSIGTGGTVGTDGLTLSQVSRPEIAILGSSTLTNGFNVNANNIIIRGFAIYGFSGGSGVGIYLNNDVTGALIEGNILGLDPTSIADPGASLRNTTNVSSNGSDNGILRNNILAYSGPTGFYMANATNGWLIENNEFLNGGYGFSNGDAIASNGTAGLTIRGNRITGTSTQGIILSGSTSSVTIENNSLFGNGVGPVGAATSQSDTIAIRSGVSSVTIYRNVIADNYGAGIAVNNGSSGVLISENSIYGNGLITSRNGSAATGQIGIDLMSSTDNVNLGTAPYYTLNDTNDIDSGGNSLQNFPVITNADSSGSDILIEGNFHGVANRTYTIELFSTSSYASGYGQGKTFLGSAIVVTDGSGGGSFSETFAKFVRAGEFITATATDQSTNETSEFGLQFAINGPVLANSDDGHLVFDGIDDYVSIANSASLTMSNTMTLESWFKAGTSTNATQMILNKEGEYEIAVHSDGTLQYAIALANNTWSWHNTGYTVTLGQWTHVAVSYDNGVISTYVNGELIDTYTQSGPIGDTYGSMNDLRLGARTNATNANFTGSIDDVRIWNVARTQTQIASNFAATLTGSEAGLVGYYAFDEQGGTTVSDGSTFGNHGTLGGGVSAALPTRVQYETGENSTLIVSAANGVLANDQDLDGDALLVTLLNGNASAIGVATTIASGATVTLNADGSFIYNPGTAFDSLPSGWTTSDSFTYTISDGNGNTESATVRVVLTGSNDAPILDNAGSMTLTSITENATSNSGDTVASILLSAGGDRITDADTGAVEGIAITNLTNGNGAWEFSTDGGVTWSSIGAVSNASALLLRGTDSIRFIPNGLNATSGDITFKAWDQTSGVYGTKVDVGAVGGATAFSTSTEIASIAVTGVNDSPILADWYDNAWSYRKQITIDHTEVSSDQDNFVLLVHLNADSDLLTHALSSGNDILFTSADGAFKLDHEIESFSTVNGELVAWVLVPRILADTDTTLFLYYGNSASINQENTNAVWATDAMAVYHLNEASGSHQDSTVYANTGTASGGISQSSGKVGFAQDFNGTDASLSINNSASINLTDNFTVSTWVKFDTLGQSDIFEKGGFGGYTLWQDNATLWFGSQNAPPSSWALSSTSLTTGAWYKIDGVISQGIVSLYVNGVLEATSSAPAVFNNAGSLVIGNGYDGHFDGTIDEVRIVNAVRTADQIAAEYANQNSPSTFMAIGGQQSRDIHLVTVDEDSTTASELASSLLQSAGYSDIDIGSLSGIAVTSISGTGTWEYSTDGTTWTGFSSVSSSNALLLAATTQIHYVPNGQNGETATLIFHAWDQTTGTASSNGAPEYATTASTGGTTAYSNSFATVSLTISSLNDAPVLDNTGSMTLTTITEDATNNNGDTIANILLSAGGDRITDVDAGAVEGIAITATANGTGTWQYSIDSGSNWIGVGTVSSTSALLLRNTDLLRFVPNGLNATSGDITFCAWDQTSGIAGTKVTTASNGGTTAFSTTLEIASVSVTSVNDAPTATFDTATAVEAGGTANGTAGTNPTGNVLTNDTDVDTGDTKTVTGVASGTQGSASGSVASSVTGSYGSINIASNGAYTYTVDNSNATVQALRTSGQTITDVFTYTMQDAAGATSTTQITVTIQGANDAPTATFDTATAVEAGGTANGTAGTNPTGNVLTNDTDPDSAGNGETKTVTGVASGTQASASGSVASSVTGSYGSINIAANGAYTYTVDNSNATVQALRTSGQTITDVFTYTMQDTAGASSTTQITVTIQGANDAPTAVLDTVTAVEAGGIANGTAGTNPTGNVLTNDTDPDSSGNGETKTVTGVASGTQASASGSVASSVTGSYGSINIAADGSYTYTVDNNNTSVQALNAISAPLIDAFTYTFTDSSGLTTTNQITISIEGSNDAPNGANTTVDSPEDTPFVFTSTDFGFSDLDSGDSLSSVRIDALPASGSLTLTGSGAVSIGQVISLADIVAGKLVFTPVADANGDAYALIAFSVGDQANAYDGTPNTITIDITPENDAPVLDNAGNTTLTTRTEDQTTNGGNTVASIIASAGGDRITDVDASPLEGIAITALSSGNGTWEYSIDGSTWNNIGVVSDTSALLLRSTDLVRFVPNAQNATTGNFSFRAWDQTGASFGAEGTKVNVSVNGGSTEYSTAVETASITVTAVNDAPTMTNGAIYNFSATNENSASSMAGAIAIVNTTGGADVDSGAVRGMAVTSVSGNGTWQYRLTGSTWYNFGNVSPTNALLLDHNAYVRYLPDGMNGETATFTYQAWDQTTGTASINGTPSYASSVTGGGTTAFSTQSATAQIVVTSVNDAATANPDSASASEAGGYNNATTGSNPSGNVLANDTDVDAGDTLTVVGIASGVQASASGSVGSTVAGTYGSIQVAADGSYTYTVDNSNAIVQALRTSGESITDIFTYTLEDSSGAPATTQITITITGANDAPTATVDNVTAVEAGGVANGTAGSNPTGNVLTNDLDVDSGDTKTITGVATGVQGSASGNVGSSLSGTYGSITLGSNGSYTYSVNNNNAAVQALRTTSDTLIDVFSYTMTDTAGLTSTTQVSVTIQGANDAPTAVDDNANAIEAGGVSNGTAGAHGTGNVLTNDTDLDSGDTKTVTGVISGPAASASGSVGSSLTGQYGSVTLNSDGSYSYVVDNNNAAVQALRTTANTLSEVFTYTMQDAAGLSSTATLTLTIQGSNDNPVAVGNTASALEAGGISNGISGTDPSGNVLTNDTDVDTGDTKTVSGVAAGTPGSASGNVGTTVSGSYGSIVINANGSYTYSVDNNNVTVEALNNGQSITDTFTYTMTDTAGATSTATIVITIDGADDLPFAVVDQDTSEEAGGLNNGTAGSTPTGNVFTNDISPHGNTLIGVAVGVQGSASGNVNTSVPGSYGSIVIDSAGVYTYTLNNALTVVEALRVTGDHLTDIFTYTFQDSLGYTSSTQVTITIDGKNDNPLGVNDLAIAVEAGGVSNGTAGSNATGNVLTNDTDVDSGDTKNVIGVVAGTAASASGSVGSSVTGTYGSVVIGANGTFSYTVNNALSSVQALRTTSDTLTELFTYSMEDTAGATSTATLTITIQGQNDNPIAVLDTITAVEAGGVSNGTAGSNPSGNVLTNDTDVDSGDTKSVSGVVSGTAGSASGNVGTGVTGTYGSIQINANGSYTYTVDNANSTVQALRTSGQSVQDVFTYTVTDTAGATSTTQVTVTIQGANDAPVLLSDSATATEAGGTANGTAGSNPSGNVLTNDSDVDAGDTMTVSGVAVGVQASASGNVGAALAGAYGSIQILSNGSYSYLVDNSNATVQALRLTTDTITDVFTYSVQDAAGVTSTTQITITIQGQNDAPVGTADNGDAYEAGGTLNGTAGSNATGNVITNDLEYDTGDTTTVSGVAAGVQGTTSGNVGSGVAGTYGSISIGSNGAYTYTIDEANTAVQALRLSSQTLTDIFSYTIVDTAGLTSTTQVTITLHGENDAPVSIADNDSIATEAGGLANGTAGSDATGNVLTNDTDVDSGDTKTVSAVVAGTQSSATGNVGSALSGSYGSITMGSNGAYTYVVDNSNSAVQALRNTSQTLQDVFTYKMVDNAGLESLTQVTITIQGANDTPTAVVDNTAIALEAGGTGNGTAGSNGTGNVLTNDTDVDTLGNGETQTVSGVAAGVQASASGNVASSVVGTYGSINIAADGSYTYVVNESNAAVQALRTSSQTLTDVFSYTMTDAAGLTSTSQVSVTIQGSNDAPVGVNDTGAAIEAGGVSNGTAGSSGTGNVLTNDTDVDASDTKGVQGVVAGGQSSASGNVGVSVTGTYGSITIGSNGAYTYVVDNSNTTVQGLRTVSDTLTDTFTYSVVDAGGLSSLATVTITITGQNDAPVAANDSANAIEAGGLANATSGSSGTGNVLTNDTDVDSLANGETKAVSGVVAGGQASASGNVGSSVTGSYGSITIAADGSYTYLVNENSVAVQALRTTSDSLTDTFTYTMTDTAGATSTATVTITIQGSNDTPTSIADNTAIATEAGGTSNGTVGTNGTGNVLTNDTDVDSIANGETKTVSGVAAGVQVSASGNVGSSVTGTYGSITVGANGAYTYVVDNNNAAVQALRTTANTLSDVFTYTMLDAGGLASTTQVTVTIQGANDAPVGINDTGNAIEAGGYSNGTAGSSGTGNVLANDTDVDSSGNGETKAVQGVVAGGQSSASGNVGSSVTGSYGSITIHSNGAYTYLVNNNHASVQALRTVSDSLTDTFTYSVVDAGGLSSLATVTITITGQNDAPTDLASGVLSVNENATNTTSVGTITPTDIDTGDSFTFQLTDDAGGRFTINTSTGEITVADGSLLNREASPSHNVTVEVTDAAGLTYSEIFTISLNDVDEFNTTAISDTNAGANQVVENATNGTTVGITASASDADATTNVITYTLDDDAGGRFQIDASTGVVTVLDGSLLNYEAIHSHAITVRATSQDASFTTQNYTIDLIDTNEGGVTAVTDSDTASNFVDENAITGTTVAITGLATDPDGTDVVTYSLDNNAGGRFTIDSTTGVVTVAGAIDREAAASYNIVVRATSTDTSSTTQSFTINIGDLDEFNVGALSDNNATANSVTENATVGTVVGITGLAVDSDATNSAISYTLFDDDGGRFTIDSSSGVVTVAGAIDREADGATRTITVRATSQDGSHTDQNFTIAIVDADEFNVSAPVDVDGTTNNVDENVVIGTLVGITASSSDADSTLSGISYSLFDDDGGNFTIDASTGIVTTAQLLNRETLSASRSITVRATSQDGSTADTIFTIAINDLDEFNVGAVSDNNVSANSVSENATVGTVVGITGLAIDSDATNSAISYTLFDDDGGRFTIDSSSGVVTVAGAIDREADGASRTITVRATSQDGSHTDQNFTIAIVDADEFNVSAPVDVDGTTNNVDENVVIGTLVGITASSSDADSTLSGISYSLFDDDGGNFTIDASTGIVTTAQLLNRETLSASRSITVRATSQDGSIADTSFTIAINDLDEFNVGALSDNNVSANSVSENATVGTVVGITGLAVDSDATNSAISYTLFDDDGGRFTIDSSSGVVTVAGAIDREADGATRTITVRATSQDGSHTDQNFTIAIVDADEFNVSAPVDVDGTTNNVDENVAIGTVVGITASSSDADSTLNGISYSLFDDDGGNFTIDASTGIVTTAQLLNRETLSASRSITVRATSQDGSIADTNFTIAINDLDEFNVGAVSDNNVSANSVSENASVGTVVGITGLAVDSDATNSAISYTLFDDDGGRFTIDSSSGVVTVAGAIDREADGASRSITVRATSQDGSHTDQNFTIAIVDVNEGVVGAVSDSNGSSNLVLENAINGTVVGLTGLAMDPDSTDLVTYSLDDDAGGRFTIDANSGIVTVSGGIDREMAASYDVSIRATSSDSSFSVQSFTINVGDVDEFNVGGVSDSTLAVNSVVENATAGTLVGITALAVDGDATNSVVTYSLLNDDGGRFAIDSNSGVVSLAGSIDREVDGAARNITVRATSTDGSFTDQGFTINVVDADEYDATTPVDVNAAINAVNENAANGTVVGITASAADSDATNNLIAYDLVDSAGGRFAIDSSTGIVTVANGSLLDREAASSHDIVIRATSADGSSSNQVFTIQLNDLDEFDLGGTTDSDATVNGVIENAAHGTTVGVTGQATDADATATTTYSLDDDAAGRFAIDVNTGIVTVSGAIDRETASSYAIVVRATSSDSSTSVQTFTIQIGDADEFDIGLIADTNLASNSLAENSANGTTVGIVAFGEDLDATTHGVSYRLLDDAAGRFQIDSTSGVVSVTDGSRLNYEANSSHGIVVEGQSQDGSTSTASFTIQVANVMENPIGNSDTFATTFLDKVQVAASGLLANDIDPDGDAMTAILVSGPSHGLLVLQGDGSFLYTPEVGYVGTVDFVYQVSDGSLISNSVLVTIEIAQPIVPPPTSGGSGGSSGSGSSGSGDSGNTGSTTSGSNSNTAEPTTETSSPSDLNGVAAVGGAESLASGGEAQNNPNPSESNSQVAALVDELTSNSNSLQDSYSFGANVLSFSNAFQSKSGSLWYSAMDSRSGESERRSSGNKSDESYLSLESDRRSDEGFSNSVSTLDHMVAQTVLGTGVVIWVVQGIQILATLLSATPAWIHLDPLNVMANNVKSDEEEDDGQESLGLFDEAKSKK